MLKAEAASPVWSAQSEDLWNVARSSLVKASLVWDGGRVSVGFREG